MQVYVPSGLQFTVLAGSSPLRKVDNIAHSPSGGMSLTSTATANATVAGVIASVVPLSASVGDSIVIQGAVPRRDLALVQKRLSQATPSALVDRCISALICVDARCGVRPSCNAWCPWARERTMYTVPPR